MSLARAVVVPLLALTLAACSSTRDEAAAAAEEPWGHAYAGSSDGWWVNWSQSLGGKAPYGPGTRFELETLGPQGIRQAETIEVVSMKPQVDGSFDVMLRSSRSPATYRATLPPGLAYTSGSPATLTARNEKLVPVTVPAGTFQAGRLWTSVPGGSAPRERDDWVVPEFPVPVQSWTRAPTATELYDPPADGTIPEGTVLTRLVRVVRQ